MALQSYCLRGVLITIIMETARVPPFKWGEISEHNSGHTPNEWGMEQKIKPKKRIIIAYDVSWNCESPIYSLEL
jgi:hypothetical protein